MYGTVKVDVHKKVETKSPTAGRSHNNWQLDRRNLPATFEQMSAHSVAMYLAQRVVGTHMFFFEYDPAVVSECHSFVFNNQRYVVKVSDNVQNLGKAWEVVCELITGAL